MKDPLTHEEKRRLLQLLYLGKQSHNELSEDFDESRRSVYTWPPNVPEDYDELLACGPYEIWSIYEGGAYELAEELLANNDPNKLDSYFLIRLAIGAACREDIQATQRFVDMALFALEKLEGEKGVDPVIFEWHSSLLRYCQLGLACQVIEDQARKAKVRERLANLLKGVIQSFSDHGRTPLPDCAHEMRILLDLGWEEEVRIVLRHLPQIYNFIGSQTVNLRLMNAFLDHGMQEHIFTMIGASRDTDARDNFRLAAARAGFARGNFALAWDMFSQMENEEGDGHGALEMIAEHAAKHQMLDSWMTILDYNQKSFHRKLSPTAEFHWMMAVSYHGSIEVRKEIWEYARRLQAMGEATDQTDITGFEIPYKVVIAALAGDSVAVQAFLQEENLAIAPKLRRKLMEAAVLHDMDFGVAWVLKHLEKEGNDMKMELLELEWLRLSANKPNEFRLLFEQIKALALTDPINYKETGWSLSWFVRRRLGDPRELKDLSVFTRRPLFGWKTPGMSEGNLEEMFAEALEMGKSSCEDHILYGLRKCLINRFGIREKMDMFESGRGWP